MPRFRNEDGVNIQLTPEEETARDAEEAQVAQDKAYYLANEKYKDDRLNGTFDNDGNRLIKGYPPIGDQLDMLWHAIDTGNWTAAKVKTTEFYTELKAVKAAYPKPEVSE